MLPFNNLTIFISAVAFGLLGALFLGPVVGWLEQAVFNGAAVGVAAWLAGMWWVKGR